MSFYATEIRRKHLLGTSTNLVCSTVTDFEDRKVRIHKKASCWTHKICHIREKLCVSQDTNK